MLARTSPPRCAAAVSRIALAQAALRAPSSRQYHSHDHPTSPTHFTRTESTILSSAYKHVPSHGFTKKALSLGAKDAGFPDISTSVLSHGLFSLIQYHLITQRLALTAQSRQIFTTANGESQLVGTKEKVARLAWERLLANRDLIHQWQEVGRLSFMPLRLNAVPDYQTRLWRSWPNRHMCRWLSKN